MVMHFGDSQMAGKKSSALRSPGPTNLIRTSIDRDCVERTVEDYIALHGDAVSARRVQYSDLVNRYYDLVTDFYEYGWGDSFHFAPRYRSETFHESLLRYQYFLALRLGLRPGMNVLDIGCGIGGPMRNIAQFSGCHVTGINNNAYQVRRAETINKACGLDSRCRVIGGDFMSIPLPDASMDAAFSIEATVHAPNWLDAFSEIRRVLKPGAQFALYDWCLTDLYDHRDPRHQAVKRGIERGAGIADLGSTLQFADALSRAGFDILDHHDHAVEGDIPWYEPLAPSSFSVAGFRRSGPGRKMTNAVVKLLELAHIAPKGAAAVAAFLDEGAAALVQGGRLGILTPMYFALARVPD
jgi:sterol 24-C-methyltransferase